MTGMTKRYARWFLVGALLVSLGGLVGCGGGDDDAAPALSGFTKTVVQGGAADNVALFDNQAQSRIQALLLAGEVDGSGFASSISFKFFGASTGNAIDNVTIQLGHTSPLAGDNLSTTFAGNVENGKGSLVTVFGPAPLVIPPGVDNGTLTIPLNGKFNYNGVDDLVIQITAGRSTKATLLRAHATSPLRNVIVAADNLASATADFVGQSLPDLKIRFTGGADAIEYNSPDENFWPFTNADNNIRVQYLYTAKEIDGLGRITGIALPVSTATAAEISSAVARIRLGHTKLGSLTTAFDNNFFGPTVTNTVAVKFPAGVPAGQYVWIPIPDNVFFYNGTDNLIVEFFVPSTTGDSLNHFSLVKASGDNTYLFESTGEPGPSLRPWQFDIKFRFAGGTTDVITAGNFADDFPFSATDNNQSQYLYRTAELGTKGTVSKVSLRLSSDSVAGTYPSLVIKLAMTDNAILGTSASGNAPGAQTVFSGSFSIPAGLKAGDWIDIPVTPFAYNSTKNLVVWTAGAAGTSENLLSAGFDATLFSNRHGFAFSNTADALAGVNDFLKDLRLTIQ